MTTAQTGPDQADPLKNAYHQGFITNPLHREFLLHKDVALLCIDMQYLDAAEGYGVFGPKHESDRKSVV